MTVGSAWQKATTVLIPAYPQRARRDARLLLGHVLRWESAYLLAHLDDPITTRAIRELEPLLEQRGRGVPLQYLLGKQEFYGLPVAVGPGVLIPRPETELLVEQALTLWEPQLPLRLADLGCGSGAIALALAFLFPRATIEAVELDPTALSWAAKNVRELGFSQGITLHLGDFNHSLTGGYHGIFCNPPYIPSGEIPRLPREVQQEPWLALDGGVDGLDFYPPLANIARRHLEPGGYLLVEIGIGQSEAVVHIFASAGLHSVNIINDLAGIPRLVQGQQH